MLPFHTSLILLIILEFLTEIKKNHFFEYFDYSYEFNFSMIIKFLVKHIFRYFNIDLL